MTDLDSRLQNWGRWLREFQPGLISAAIDSIEGNYRSPQHWHPIGSRPIAAKEADAWDICLACATLAMRYHLTLKLVYMRQLPDRDVGRVLRRQLRERIMARDVPAIVGMGKSLLQNALTEPLAIRRERARDRVQRIICATLDLQID